jgi:hypothetical protein
LTLSSQTNTQTQTQAQQQLSSRVSQTSSASTNQAGQPPSRQQSFLPSRIGSGHRRPPSQQQTRPDVHPSGQASPEISQQPPAATMYRAGQVQAQPIGFYQGNPGSQAPLPQQQQAVNPVPYGVFNQRGNLPRLGPSSYVPPTSNQGAFGAGRFAPVQGSLVNGGHNASRQSIGSHNSDSGVSSTAGYRPLQSQQRSRYY